ncbi:MAG TPA: FAD-linked oxidase C-terminal domain-containing protein [Gemmatimonadaceae bacterium]|nr:FAD-linked oxidase C-terminal domain-containing protein [Gemmatimonadaceae bacterium]
MSSELEVVLSQALAGEIRFDAYTRHLYSTDASMYAIEPIGVAFPRHADDVVAAMEIAGRFGVPVLPRGGGTSLGGQTVGRAIVLDCSRYMHGLVSLDAETRTARVQPGLVQDDLNRAAAAHGLWFAPDTSTANRATLGGMIGNNSCGARSARYGMTIDHVESLDVVLADGSRARLAPVDDSTVAARGRGSSLEARLYREIPALVSRHADAIDRDMPAYWRRSGGYRLERMVPERGPFNLANLVVGSEGTLAVVVEATVRLVPQPKAVVALAGHFADPIAAIRAVEDARACHAAAIELVDRFILDLARRSAVHGELVSILAGDPGALLWVEFYGESLAEAQACAQQLERQWRASAHGYAIARAETAADLQRYRELRKAGLGLLMAAGEGQERSVAFVEDTAVDPARLAEYTERFAAILARHGLRAGFYGHASAGCLHIRPFMDLARPGEVQRLRAVAEEVCELVTEFGGMNSSEHGDGLVRSEFNRRIFGEELYGAMRDLKRIFDPEGRLNPGKKVDAPPMTDDLREPVLPAARALQTHFPFDAHGGMRDTANRCVRIGACRKSAASGGTMCPSFMATRDEQHSTRGRANALVHALSSPDPEAALGDARLYETLDLCLECKACKSECPMSVDMAALKAEFLSHYHERHGVPFRARMFGNARALNRAGSALAPLANLIARSRILRAAAERLAGIDRRRALPLFQRESLPAWFRRRSRKAGSRQARRGHVVFLADSFTSYTEPWIGRAAIELLELAGWEIELVDDVCCGRAHISKGLLAEARVRHAALIARLGPLAEAGVPIVGCEPSCVFTLCDELPALARGDAGATAIARQARLVDGVLAEAVAEGSLRCAGDAAHPPRRVLFHGHCHQKAAGALAGSVSLLRQIPGAQVEVLDAGCCGMAGSFGFEREHYDLSMQIGGMRLFPAVQAAPDALIAATGVSCRQQIAQGTGRKAVHPVMLLHEAVAPQSMEVARTPPPPARGAQPRSRAPGC